MARASIERFERDHPSASNAKLVLAGYSAGSLYATAAQLTSSELPSVFDSTIRYLLISYPLDKLWALSLFSGARWKQRVPERASNAELLLIHGTADQFTKVEVSDEQRGSDGSSLLLVPHRAIANGPESSRSCAAYASQSSMVLITFGRRNSTAKPS